MRKTEIQDLSTQVYLTVWVSLNDATPSTTNRERERDFQSKVNTPLADRPRGARYRGKRRTNPSARHTRLPLHAVPCISPLI
jgi:hypothetical protein